MTRKNVMWAGAAVAAVGLGILGYVKRAFLRKKAQDAKNYLQEKVSKVRGSLSFEDELLEDE